MFYESPQHDFSLFKKIRRNPKTKNPKAHITWTRIHPKNVAQRKRRWSFLYNSRYMAVLKLWAVIIVQPFPWMVNNWTRTGP